MSGARAAKAGKMDKGVPVEVTGDTPLPVKEIVHENSHASGGSELSSRSSKGWTPSRRAKARETAARVERMEKAQETMRESQEEAAARMMRMEKSQGEMRERMEKSQATMDKILESVGQVLARSGGAERSRNSGTSGGEKRG